MAPGQEFRKSALQHAKTAIRRTAFAAAMAAGVLALPMAGNNSAIKFRSPLPDGIFKSASASSMPSLFRQDSQSALQQGMHAFPILGKSAVQLQFGKSLQLVDLSEHKFNGVRVSDIIGKFTNFTTHSLRIGKNEACMILQDGSLPLVFIDKSDEKFGITVPGITLVQKGEKVLSHSFLGGEPKEGNFRGLAILTSGGIITISSRFKVSKLPSQPDWGVKLGEGASLLLEETSENKATATITGQRSGKLRVSLGF